MIEPITKLEGKKDVRERISVEELSKYLVIYKKDTILIKEANYNLANSQLNLIFKKFDFGLTEIEISHFTREHVVLFVTQAAYVLGGMLAKYGELNPLTKQKYIALLLKDKPRFVKFQIEFRKQIENRENIK